MIEATTAAFPGMLKKIEIHGSHGSAVIEEEDIKTWEFAKMTAQDKRIAASTETLTDTGGGAADPGAIGHAAHAKQFKDFVKAIKTGSQPVIDGAEGPEKRRDNFGDLQSRRNREIDFAAVS